jgi:hypothetical protein
MDLQKKIDMERNAHVHNAGIVTNGFGKFKELTRTRPSRQ